MLRQSLQRQLGQLVPVPLVVGARRVLGQPAHAQHDRVEVGHLDVERALADELAQRLGHEHVPARQQGAAARARRPPRRHGDEPALAAARRAVEVEVRVGLEQVEHELLILQQGALVDQPGPPTVGRAAGGGEGGEQGIRDVGRVLSRQGCRVDAHPLRLAEPRAVLGQHPLDRLGGLREVVAPRQLPLEERQIVRRAVVELPAPQVREPHQAGDRLVAVQQVALLEEAADAAASTVQLHERVLRRPRILGEEPLPVAVLHVLRRLRLDEQDALAGRNDDRVDLPAQAGHMLPDREPGHDDPVVFALEALEGGEELALAAVRLLGQVGGVHAGHGVETSSECDTSTVAVQHTGCVIVGTPPSRDPLRGRRGAPTIAWLDHHSRRLSALSSSRPAGGMTCHPSCVRTSAASACRSRTAERNCRRRQRSRPESTTFRQPGTLSTPHS